MTSLTAGRHKAGRRLFGATVPKASSAFIITSGLLLFYLLLGGSSRFDNLSLPFLRPVAVIATFYGLWQLPALRQRTARTMLGFMSATFLVVALYLVPLPPAWWQGLPGRDAIVRVDHVAGLGDVYRPLSISPVLTGNALFALFVPASILVNGLCLTDDELRGLAPVVMIGALVSCMLAVAQMLGPSDGPLYLYRSTTNGAAVGLFANRNHHAVFLASVLAVIATYAASGPAIRTIAGQRRRHVTSQRRPFVALLLACLILPMLLVIGSRGGLAATIGVLVSLPFLYAMAAERKFATLAPGIRIALATAIMVLAAIVLWATLSSRAETLARLTNPGGDQELRFKVWPVVFDHLARFAPFGPGPGTYEVAYKLIEPDQDLRPTYSNHAHNDWLEIPFTMGAPGILLLLLTLAWVARSGAVMIIRRRLLPDRAWGWTGIVMLLAFGIGSSVDYPLRVPSLLALAVVACLWIRLGATAPAHDQGTD